MSALMGSLTKSVPDNLQIVGPRFAGKSVVLKALLPKMVSTGYYTAVVYWDLGHQTPASDEEFLCGLRDVLATGLESTQPDLAKYLRVAEQSIYGDLCDVFDELSKLEAKVLMLWDGFDKPLEKNKLTVNLWDQLRAMAQRSSLRLVTASRKPLADLIRSPESQTSDFWNIFKLSPVRVEGFDEDDVKEVLETIPEVHLDTGARTELLNWTGNSPVLLLSLLNALAKSGAIDGEAVNVAGKSIDEGVLALVGTLWRDCPQTAKDAYHHIRRAPRVGRLPEPDLQCLAERGFVIKSPSGPKACNRLLERHLEANSESAGISNLLSSPEVWRANMRQFLERRHALVASKDSRLNRYIRRAIEDLPDDPDQCMRSVRGIVDSALDDVFLAELGPAREIPAAWLDEWDYDHEKLDDTWRREFPKDQRGSQVKLLNFMTGTEKIRHRKARLVSKGTVVLMSSAHGLANFGQHPGGPMDLHVALAALSVCIELAGAIDREIHSGHSTGANS